jgi:hypothetical protein
MEAADAEMRVNRDSKYAETLPGGNLKTNLNPYLTDKEHDDAVKWAWLWDYENILAWGEKGTGKGVHIHKMVKNAKWYYSKHIIMDTPPYELFDLEFMPRYYDLALRNPHEPILLRHTDFTPFTKQEFIRQLTIMGDASLGALADEANPEMAKMEKEKAADIRRLSGLWMSQYGMSLFQNGILVLDEVKRYHHYLRQNEPMGVMLTDNDDFLRHIHLCRVGMTVYYKQLDPNNYLPKVSVEIKCNKSEYNSHVFMGNMSKVTYIEAKKNRLFKPLQIFRQDVLAPWDLLGGTIAEITSHGIKILETLKDEKEPEAVKLYKVLSYINGCGGRATISDIPIRTLLKNWEVTEILLSYYNPYSDETLIKLQYAIAHIKQDLDKGFYAPKTGVRSTDVILLDDTTGFRKQNGVAWIENEYIGYAICTDKYGYAYDNKGEAQGKYDYPDALIGVQRRLNWRLNHCEPMEHKAGAEIYTGYGIGDIYDSWIPIGVQIPKSMMK